MKKKVSAVVACYKDEKAIPIMYKRLTDIFKKIKCKYEIIFVNDGSPDNSEQVLQKIAIRDSHVYVINHSRNFNSQQAFTSGIDIATGNAVVLLDGDLQDPPEIIEKFYKKWVEGYDVVYGIRVKRKAPVHMSLFYKLFYRVFNKLSYVNIPLDAGDFSLMDGKVVSVLRKLPERDRFIRGLRAWVGFKQIGVAYVRPERMFGRTTNNFFKNINWALKGIFSFSYVPLQVMTFLSFFVFLISLAAIIYQICIKIFFNITPPGITTILIAIFFFGAIQLLGISVLGQYIGKIFEEVKMRPKYIVKSIFHKKNK